MERDLEHPKLAKLKSWYDRHMPQKTRGSAQAEEGLQA